MRRIILAVIAAIAVFSSVVQAQSSRVHLNESGIRAILKDNATVVILPVSNFAERPVKAHVSLAWINPEDTELSATGTAITMPPGRSEIEVPFPLVKPSIWTRLRYSLAPDTSEARTFAPFDGILFLPYIADYAFEMKITMVGFPQQSRKQFSFFAAAVHPVTKTPITDIEWTAALDDGSNPAQPGQILTREDGFAEFVFDFPDELKKSTGKAKVKISGRSGDFTRSEEYDLSVGHNIVNYFNARIQTDKPLYQPGQTIHIRAVIVDPAGRAAENEEVILTIRDEDTDVHYARLVSSSFGIVQDDWVIPDAAALGDYSIRLATRGENRLAHSYYVVRVSRYELPVFSVTARLDRVAYLPSEQPEITITGAYLFGKPVPNGKVRIIRYSDDYWTKDEEETVAEGDANAQGVFVAHIDIEKDHKEFASVEGSRFRDLRFAAYYLDADSGRTEQRRFDIRISKQPIHIYIFRTGAGSLLPAPSYITTYYADGSPASASLEILFRNQTIKARANSAGLAKVFLPVPSARDDRGTFSRSPYFQIEDIKIKAVDDNGISGIFSTELYFDLRDYLLLRMETERTLYRPGESVTLRIQSPEEAPSSQAVMIHAIADKWTLASRVVRLENHRGEVTFPWQPEFQGAVTFGALSSPDFKRSDLGAKTVIFPAEVDIKVQAATDRGSYKPGENAVLNVRVTSADGRPVEAALGVAIVDQSVLERARADSEFGGNSYFNCVFCSRFSMYEIGGLELSDLYAIKPDTPITPELDLIAEALAANTWASIDGRSNEHTTSPPEFDVIKKQIAELRSALNYTSNLGFPQNEDEMDRILRHHRPRGITRNQIGEEMVSRKSFEWRSLKDPWGSPYYPEFGIRTDYSKGILHTILIWSAGMDKQRGTEDDFIAGTFEKDYFAQTRDLIRSALSKQKYPATYEEFLEILHKNGLWLETLRDPWGNPWQVDFIPYGSQQRIRIRSLGKPDGRDAVNVAQFSSGRLSEEINNISKALKNSGVLPKTIEDFSKILNDAGVNLSSIRDTNGKPYKIVKDSSVSERIFPRHKVMRIYGESPELVTESLAGKRTYDVFSLCSDDYVSGSHRSDLVFVNFKIPIKEEFPQDDISIEPVPESFTGAGRIHGTVVGQGGGVVSGATVTLRQNGAALRQTLTDETGSFVMPALPDGAYSLLVIADGFMLYEIVGIPVSGEKPVEINIELYIKDFVPIGNTELPSPRFTTELVGEFDTILESGASTGTVAESYTPRVREYFPETLLWLPELITGTDGRAKTNVKLADSITKWKIAVIASTKDGRIAEAESDFRAFQPFFLEFNPPQTLTEGDEVTLPVTARNYQNKAQKTKIRVAPNDWSEILSGGEQNINIPANESVNAGFTVRAKHAMEKASQRIIAEAGRNGDAIEKSFRVHPDGQEITRTYGDLVTGAVNFTASIPQNAIRGATRGRLRVYPNIASLLFESAAAMLNEPLGCAEQTISAGYANLIALRFARANQSASRDGEIEKNILNNISLAVDRLKGFREHYDGIRYWLSSGDPDAAVTAYAVSFLIEASEFVPVDPNDINFTISWIEENQDKWLPQTGKPLGSFMNRPAPALTASVARTLAAAKKNGFEIQSGILGSAYHVLAQITDVESDPYMLADFMLAAFDSGDEGIIGDAGRRLIGMAREDNGSVFWQLQSESPFYGWGTAGRVETTGLAISALSAFRARLVEIARRSDTLSEQYGVNSYHELDSLIRRGLTYLLRKRAYAGHWNSTQATLRALHAIVAASDVVGGFGGQGGRLEIRADGKLVQTIEVSKTEGSVNPIVIDMSEFLESGDNAITLTPSEDMQAAMILFSSSHWLPWEQTDARTSQELRLNVRCGQSDQVKARVGDIVNCFVEAERAGSRNYGMMIAAIGLPPGAEADRASLESLIRDEDSGVTRYEVLPDRIIFYLWPSKNVASFRFNVSARFPMNAKSEPSILYDYYNPEALSEVAPIRWNVF